jgi:hypothetical protein
MEYSKNSTTVLTEPFRVMPVCVACALPVATIVGTHSRPTCKRRADRFNWVALYGSLCAPNSPAGASSRGK